MKTVAVVIFVTVVVMFVAAVVWLAFHAPNEGRKRNHEDYLDHD